MSEIQAPGWQVTVRPGAGGPADRHPCPDPWSALVLAVVIRRYWPGLSATVGRLSGTDRAEMSAAAPLTTPAVPAPAPAPVSGERTDTDALVSAQPLTYDLERLLQPAALPDQPIASTTAPVTHSNPRRAGVATAQSRRW